MLRKIRPRSAAWLGRGRSYLGQDGAVVLQRGNLAGSRDSLLLQLFARLRPRIVPRVPNLFDIDTGIFQEQANREIPGLDLCSLRSECGVRRSL